MDPRRLAIFLAVVDEGGFTRAGDSLGMSQPAVSQAVRELEGALGTMLFHRIGRGVRLTPAGEALVLPARQVHRYLEKARLVVQEVAGLGAGRLDLACLPTLAADPLGPLLRSFRVAYPEVGVVLANAADTADLLHLVRSGRCEVGLGSGVAAEGLHSVVIGNQDFLAVLPPGTTCSDPLPAIELAAMPLVATPHGSSSRELLDEILRGTDGTARVVVETAQREALLPLVASGVGSALLPRSLAEVAKWLGCVVATPVPPVRRSIAVVYRDAPMTVAAVRFVELARSVGERSKAEEGPKCA